VNIENSSFLGWVLAGVATIIASLTTALTWMYKKQVSDYEKDKDILRAIAEKEKEELLKEKTRLEAKIEKLEEKVDACQEEHYQAKIELAKINERLRLLEAKSCKGDECPIKDYILPADLTIQKRIE